MGTRKNQTAEDTLHRQTVNIYRRLVKPAFPHSRIIANNFPSLIFKPPHYLTSRQRAQHVAWCRQIIHQAKTLGYDRSQPDIMITQHRTIGSIPYAGIALELKKKDAKIYKKDGSLFADQHLEEQQQMLSDLEKQGYYARFAQGIDEVIYHFNMYFGLKIK